MEFSKENFNEWYNEVVEKAGLVDKRYPVKGMNVWLPYGWAIARRIDETLRELMFSHNHEEVYFPLLIPKDQFAKEEEHIRGFGGEVFWVEKGGDTPLDIPLALRPTSETAMYPLFSLWIRTHGDLPLKIFQIVNVFRYETKQTRVFLRVREIHFFEAHTCHRSYEEAEEQIMEDREIWRIFCDRLALPYILNRRPDWDKFAGAHYTIAADTIMPSGRPLQIGTMHNYRQNFSRAYDIMFLDEEGKRDYVHQTTFGISERVIGAIVGIHGDDRGLIIPPEIAPYQVVIIPIVGEDKERVIEESRRILGEVSKRYRAKLDERDNYTPGYKFYDWEMKGVPLRIEIGPRDLKNNVVTLARRDTFERITVPRDSYLEEIGRILNNIQENLKERAWRRMESLIERAETLEDIAKSQKVNVIHWCGSEECARRIDQETGKNVLGIPVDSEGKSGRCAVCGKETNIVCYVGKSY
ncbi:MAG: proline--tRNA ligase [Thermoplasmata archaeon]|jgi:prolyl-tRNA synthetase|nr:proline--tRNA ligase [Thermoplasmatales archaeon]